MPRLMQDKLMEPSGKSMWAKKKRALLQTEEEDWCKSSAKSRKESSRKYNGIKAQESLYISSEPTVGTVVGEDTYGKGRRDRKSRVRGSVGANEEGQSIDKVQTSRNAQVPSQWQKEQSPSPLHPEPSGTLSTWSYASTRDLTIDDSFNLLHDPGEDHYPKRQSVPVLSILLVATQICILVIQLILCGMAPFDVNGFLGPYPSTFSEWGGKNSYLMIREHEWWRLVTPSFLSVGIFHLVINGFCHLESVALFEREWGSFRWLVIYLLSSVGCQFCSTIFDEDTIAVGSSGALMGMFGGKLAEIITLSLFDLKDDRYDDLVRVDQISSTMCGMALVFILSAFTYIDWSGLVGGFLFGFLGGVILLSGPVGSCCTRFFWISFSLLGLSSSTAGVLYLILTKIEPDDQLADVCDYFRAFFPEDYECQCL
jgi:rhomboid protease GluP